MQESKDIPDPDAGRHFFGQLIFLTEPFDDLLQALFLIFCRKIQQLQQLMIRASPGSPRKLLLFLQKLGNQRDHVRLLKNLLPALF